MIVIRPMHFVILCLLSTPPLPHHFHCLRNGYSYQSMEDIFVNRLNIVICVLKVYGVYGCNYFFFCISIFHSQVILSESKKYVSYI